MGEGDDRVESEYDEETQGKESSISILPKLAETLPTCPQDEREENGRGDNTGLTREKLAKPLQAFPEREIFCQSDARGMPKRYPVIGPVPIQNACQTHKRNGQRKERLLAAQPLSVDQYEVEKEADVEKVMVYFASMPSPRARPARYHMLFSPWTALWTAYMAKAQKKISSGSTVIKTDPAQVAGNARAASMARRAARSFLAMRNVKA